METFVPEYGAASRDPGEFRKTHRLLDVAKMRAISFSVADVHEGPFRLELLDFHAEMDEEVAI